MKIAKEIAKDALLVHGNVTGPNAGFMVISENDLATIINEKLGSVRNAIYLVLNCGWWYYSALEIDVYGHGYNGENIEKELKSALTMLSNDE